MERLLVVDGAGGIGDTLMTTPALRALRRMCPAAHITIATEHPWVYDHNPDVDQALPRFAGHGSGPYERQIVLEHPDVWDTRVPIIEKNLRLVGAPSTAPSTPALYLTEGELQRGGARVDELGRVVAIHTTSPIPSKMWLPEYWETVVRALRERGYTVVQVGRAGEEVVPGAVSWLGVEFREMAAALRRCEFAIAIDSAVQHAAAAVGCRAIVLFSGAAPPELARYPQHTNVVTPSTCRCQGSRSNTIPCLHDRECMRALGPERVLAAIDELTGAGAAA